MRYSPIAIRESDVVVLPQTLGNVVGIEQGNLGHLGQALTTEHLDVRPGNDIDGGGTVGRGADGGDGRGAADRGEERMGREEGREVGFAGDWADTGTAASVGDREGLIRCQH